MADGATTENRGANAISEPAPQMARPPQSVAARAFGPAVGAARPHRGRLITIDPVLQHEYRGLFATRWLGRIGWLLLALMLLLAVTVAAYVIGFGLLWSVSEWRGETVLFDSAAGMTDLVAGNGYGFAVLALVGIGFAIPALIVSRVFYGRWWHALSYDSQFRWYNFVKAGTAYALVMLTGAAYGYWTSEEQYSATSILTDPPDGYAIWFGIGLVAIFIQSFGEEFLFRGLLPRIFGVIIPFRLIAVGIVIAIFISLHVGNPDVGQDLTLNLMLFAVMEVVYFTIVFRTRSISATWAMHWINNSFIFLLISTEPGRQSSMVPFIYTDPVWSAGGSYLMQPQVYVEFAAGVALLCTLLFWKRSPFYLPWHDEKQ